jgi:hypothetical protein
MSYKITGFCRIARDDGDVSPRHILNHADVVVVVFRDAVAALETIPANKRVTSANLAEVTRLICVRGVYGG